VKKKDQEASLFLDPPQVVIEKMIREVVPENWTVGISGIAALRWHHDAI